DDDGVGSDYLTVVAERGAEQAVAQTFATALARGTFGPWDEVLLPKLAGDCAMTTHLVEAFAHAGLSAARTQTTVAAYISLPATWDDYLKSLPKRHRYDILRAQRDFDVWAEGTDTIHRVDVLADLAKGQHVLATLHNDRWQREGVAGA